ncbi:MAG TPA: glycerophosphodiester phosphodiesterase [Tissierellaceae bacterium]|nr:glycerophosphodiester phosphodiesterase [Tissierellaceae bacterium]
MIKNYAHRGFKGKYPENTMLAFKKAVEEGADGIEFDIQLSKDGEIVIIHDETLDRTTNGTGLVKDYTVKELIKLNASYNEQKDHGFNPIPTLREYLEYIQDKEIISNIELKNSIIDYDNLEENVLDLISEFKLEDRVLISSFNHESIVKVKEINKNIRCGVLTGSWLINPGEYTKSLGVESYHPSAYSLDKKIITELHNNEIEVNVWIDYMNFPLEKLIDLNVDGIITDNVDQLNKLLKR